MKKLYRQHRGSLIDSLGTTIEVKNLKDILDIENNLIYKDFHYKNYYSNIHTDYIGNDSQRCGNNWKETYYVLVDFDGYKQQCIGMCNFKN